MTSTMVPAPTAPSPKAGKAAKTATPIIPKQKDAIDVEVVDAVPPQSVPPRLSKLDHLVVLLKRDDGASLSELVQALVWQAHSVRGAIAGSLKRKGHHVTSERVDGIRRYRIKAVA